MIDAKLLPPFPVAPPDEANTCALLGCYRIAVFSLPHGRYCKGHALGWLDSAVKAARLALDTNQTQRALVESMDQPEQSPELAAYATAMYERMARIAEIYREQEGKRPKRGRPRRNAAPLPPIEPSTP